MPATVTIIMAMTLRTAINQAPSRGVGCQLGFMNLNENDSC